MPMKVHPSHTGDVAAARATSASTKTPARTSFASLLAQSTTTAPGTDVSTQSTVALRKGETMTPVTGHAYAEISGGKRDGLYVNTSHNKRHGQAFVLVHKHGREYHIYGTGTDRVVVALRKPTETAKHDTATTNTASGTGGTTPTVSAS
jgi:hypothetical protein